MLNTLFGQSKYYVDFLDAQIAALLTPYSRPADWADLMLARVNEKKTRVAQVAAADAARRCAEIARLNLRLERLLDEVIERSDYTAEKGRLMGRKKPPEEQELAASADRADWLEPYERWIETARITGEIAVSGALPEKRVLARQMRGSNLVLNGKKARGCIVES